MSSELDGKVFLVTGGTEGIGKAAALEFAKRGATLVLVGRNRDKTDRVASEIVEASGNKHVETLLGDLSVIADVRKVAAEFRAKHDRLDVLVNNAGAVFMDYATTSDGFERTFALNHVSYFLLAHELRDLLEKTSGARVVSTASGAHIIGRCDLETIAKRDGSAGLAAYGDSKLANILFTRELSRRLAGRGVFVSCFHPGFVRSGFARNNDGFIAGTIKMASRLFARTPEKGAETLVWLATSSEPLGEPGEYFQDRKRAKTSKRAQDAALATGMWKLSEKLCGIAASA